MSGESAGWTPPDIGMPIEHVMDRDGYVWRVVRDGGMATRAHYTGLVSIGIEELRRTAGPLSSIAPVAEARETIARAEAACRPCGPCDSGLCTCDPEPRQVIADLLKLLAPTSERGRDDG